MTFFEYICFDLETTASGGPDHNSPEAHWKDNKVLMCGFEHNNVTHISSSVHDLGRKIKEIQDRSDTPCLVAHNAKFDIKYLMRDLGSAIDWSSVVVWDTMTWEYLNSGHRSKMMSLEEVAKLHNVPFKKSLDLGALLKSGVKMEDIDRNELADYLREDVNTVSRIHKMQQGRFHNMQYLLPLCEMELNGMCVDTFKAEALAYQLAGEIGCIEEQFITLIKNECEWQDGSEIEDIDFTEAGVKSKCIKPMASRTLSFLLTGVPSELNVTPKWKVRFKEHSSYPVYDKPPPRYIDPCPVRGYSMSESVLEDEPHLLAHDALQHRKANKMLSTYVGPMLHSAKVQGTIHPKLNTALTNTGRLSSSNPNGQNMPPEARALIEGVHIMEIDFSQLELVAVACISGDKQLIYDLSHGVDIHRNTASMVFGEDNADTMRKIAKNVNFGVLYGGKATGLSHQTGVDKAQVQKLIDAFYKKYPGVARWQRAIFDEVVENMVPYDVKDGEQRYRSTYLLPISGRSFTFIEEKSPAWLRRKTGRKFSFSPQQTSNYPIQGFAGGDIVMKFLWNFWKLTRSNYKEIRFLMTVHDSVIVEVSPNYTGIKGVIEQAAEQTQRDFCLPLELKYEVEISTNWS